MTLVLTLLLGCKPELLTGIDNLPGGNPLVPEMALFPFPSDFYVVDDASTPSGRRVAIPDEALPGPLLPETFAHLDGWTRAPVILAQLPGGIDPASLPAANDPGASVAVDSPVQLLDTVTGERVPLLAELDAQAESPEIQALILRPQRALAWNTRHVVVLTNGLARPDGAAHVANNAFRALRDGIATDSDAVESQRAEFEHVNAALAAAGLDPQGVVLAWSFTTGSEAAVAGPLVSMMDQMARLNPEDVEITSEGNDGANDLFRVAYQVPNFIGPNGHFSVGSDGEVDVHGTRELVYQITVPNSVMEDARPTMLFGHGFFASMEEPTWGSLQALVQPGEIPVLSTTFHGFDEASQLTTVSILGGDPNRAGEIAALQMQSQANHVAVLRHLPDAATTIEVQRGDATIRPLNAENLTYLGISNGGTQGFSICSTAPGLGRCVLVVPGGAMGHMLERAVQWNQLGSLFSQHFPDPRELQVGIGLMQHLLDPFDGINHVDHLVDDRLLGRDPMKVQLHEAVGDTQVANVITEWMARSAGVPPFEDHTREAWGFTPITMRTDGIYDVPAAWYSYDEGYDPLPSGNVAPPAENGAHESIRRLPAYQEHVLRFLDDGTHINVCDGPCDPG